MDNYSIYPPLQKVYIIDCLHCGSFLTNRGMRAVLLLRPHVSLFSTDALPVNCSPYSANTTSARARRSSELVSKRTCSCLTQTLLCQGCGNAVGYMILCPCDLCTSSTSVHSHSSNNHRFVFHCDSVRSYERRYIEDDPHVSQKFSHNIMPRPSTIACDVTPVAASWVSNTSAQVNGVSVTGEAAECPPDMRSATIITRNLSSPLVSRQLDRLPQAGFHDAAYSVVLRSLDLLRVGDTVYWHQLVQNGEIRACVDVSHARGIVVA